MLTLRRIMTGTLLILALAQAAVFGADRDFYVTAIGGLTWQGDQPLDLATGEETARGDAALGSGFLSGAAFGYRFANGWRVEGEFVYQTVDHDGRAFDIPELAGDGNFASTSVALNVLYEFDLFGSPRARTYVGAGFVFFDEIDIDFESGGVENSFSGDSTGFQLLFGARYDLGERWFVDSGLRYAAASGVELREEGPAGRRIEADYDPLSVTASVGFRF